MSTPPSPRASVLVRRAGRVPSRGVADDLDDLVTAIVAGDVDRVGALLGEDPSRATATLPGNPRSMLHHATDWPGHRPGVADTIALLVAAGADPDVAMPASEDGVVAETPLHWAASCDDVAAIDALLAGGATVDALGGIFGGCTPFEEAIIFDNDAAARRLLEAGATNYLPGAAALGRTDLIDSFFDGSDLRTDVGVLPHWATFPPVQIVLDRAFQFACRAGHLDIARTLHGRGADPSSITPAGTSALDEASGNGHDHVVAWLDGLT